MVQCKKEGREKGEEGVDRRRERHILITIQN